MNTNNARTHGESVKAGLVAKVQRGTPTGPVPLGYHKVREQGEVHVLIDKVVAPIVREAFDLAADGIPLRTVLDRVTARGLRSVHGKALGPSALWGILNNPFYQGHIRFSGCYIAGSHEPIITRDTFYKAKKQLQGRCKNSAPRQLTNNSTTSD